MFTKAKIVLLILITGLLDNCGGAKAGDALMSLVPIALQGGLDKKTYREPQSASGSTDGSVSQSNSYDDPTLYQPTDNPTSASCVGGKKDPGSGFGTTATNGVVYAQASFSLCSSNDVDRFKSIEIIFSQPMDMQSVEAAFSISSDSGPLPGPSPKGTFTWLSPTRLIFDPYTELESRETYTITILNTAKTMDGTPFQEFLDTFTTTHNFAMKHTLKQGNFTVVLGGDKDITFDKTAGNIILDSDFVKPQGAFEEIGSITFNRLGNVDSAGLPNQSAKFVCTDTCNFLGTPINLNTDFDLQSDAMKIRDGGNTYYFEIKNKSGKFFRKYISFNYGIINKNPNDLIQNVASGVLDEAQMVKMLERLIEVFTQAKFKISGKSFVDFANENKTSVKNTKKCIDYENFSFIKTYGDHDDGGYCGPDGDVSKFIGKFSNFLLGSSDFYMDVYITSVEIPGFVSGNPTIDAGMKVLENHKIAIDLNGKKL